MILVPYIWTKTNPEWISLGIFLCSGGRKFWSIEKATQAKTSLKDNGFPVIELHTDKQAGIIYAMIDSTKIQMEEFYTWDEVDPVVCEQDVWRFFKIPVVLWSCPVFKENFWKTANLPIPLPLFNSMV